MNSSFEENEENQKIGFFGYPDPIEAHGLYESYIEFVQIPPLRDLIPFSEDRDILHIFIFPSFEPYNFILQSRTKNEEIWYGIVKQMDNGWYGVLNLYDEIFYNLGFTDEDTRMKSDAPYVVLLYHAIKKYFTIKKTNFKRRLQKLFKSSAQIEAEEEVDPWKYYLERKTFSGILNGLLNNDSLKGGLSMDVAEPYFEDAKRERLVEIKSRSFSLETSASNESIKKFVEDLEEISSLPQNHFMMDGTRYLIEFYIDGKYTFWDSYGRRSFSNETDLFLSKLINPILNKYEKPYFADRPKELEKNPKHQFLLEDLSKENLDLEKILCPVCNESLNIDIHCLEITEEFNRLFVNTYCTKEPTHLGAATYKPKKHQTFQGLCKTFGLNPNQRTRILSRSGKIITAKQIIYEFREGT